MARDSLLEDALDNVLDGSETPESKLPLLRGFPAYAEIRKDIETTRRAMRALNILYDHDDLKDLYVKLESLQMAIGIQDFVDNWKAISAELNPEFVEAVEQAFNIN